MEMDGIQGPGFTGNSEVFPLLKCCFVSEQGLDCRESSSSLAQNTHTHRILFRETAAVINFLKKINK